ncbi:MAG: OmpA family protein [Mariprofundaceae bacterium]
MCSSDLWETTQTFRQKYKLLLQAKKSAEASLKALNKEGASFPASDDPHTLLSEAEDELAAAVKGMEEGRLNETQQHATAAESLYRKALDIMIPGLSARASRLISKASSAGAKRYAPQTLQAAMDRAGSLRAYADGLSDSVPERPADALNLARAALDLARQVKAWRKKPASHEELVLNGRNLRMQLARHLHMPVDTADPVADVTAADLLKAVDTLQNDLQEERFAHQADIKRLQAEHKVELEAKLAEQRSTFLQARNAQLSSMKEAFRAKLERETFEKKRQARVLKLFKPGEASILANLDGSLVIRLTGLQFAPNKSKIDEKYYQLLSRLKQALDVYSDRNVRIEGHTDNQGDVKSNQLLSLKRAEAVRDFLVAAEVDSSRLKALGYGEVRPIASNEFARGRAMNRRIDITIEAASEEKSK